MPVIVSIAGGSLAGVFGVTPGAVAPAAASAEPGIPPEERVVDTLAGTGETGTPEPGVLAADATLTGPESVAAGPDGTVYITAGVALAGDPYPTSTWASSPDDARRVHQVRDDGTLDTIVGADLTDLTGGIGGRGGAAVAPDGTLYAADMDQHVVRAVSPSGEVTTVAGQVGHQGDGGNGGLATDAELKVPVDVTVGTDGTVYIADAGNERIRAVDPAGVISTVAHTGDLSATIAGSSGARALAIDADGTLYWSYDVLVSVDGDLHEAANLMRRNPDGSIDTVVAGDATPATPRAIVDLAIDGDGRVWAADPYANRVHVIDPDHGTVTTLGGQGSFEIPREDGGVADELDSVLVFGGGPEDGRSTPLGDGGTALDAEFGLPTGVAVGADGTVYVAGWGNSRVRTIGIERAGEPVPAVEPVDLTTVAGSGADTVDDDAELDTGPLWRPLHASEVRLAQPTDVAVGEDGTLYVADPGNGRVRAIDPDDATVRTVAGGGRRSAAHAFDAASTAGDTVSATDVKMGEPAAVAITGDTLFIASHDEAELHVVDVETGDLTAVIAGAPPLWPELALDPGGETLYVVGAETDAADSRICAVDVSEPRSCRRVAEQDGPIGGIAVGSDGTVYLSDVEQHRVRGYDPETEQLRTVAGNGDRDSSGDGGPASDAAVLAPTALALGPQDVLYIGDGENGRIRAVDLRSGIIETVADTPSPSGLAVDAAGTVFVADSAGDVVMAVGEVEVAEPAPQWRHYARVASVGAVGLGLSVGILVVVLRVRRWLLSDDTIVESGGS